MSTPPPSGRRANPAATSSPLQFPSSSQAGTPTRNNVRGTPRASAIRKAAHASSSPRLQASTPVPAGRGRSNLWSDSNGLPSSNGDLPSDGTVRHAGRNGDAPLFFEAPSTGGSTPRRARRGDIHSSLPMGMSIQGTPTANRGRPSSNFGRTSSPIGVNMDTDDVDMDADNDGAQVGHPPSFSAGPTSQSDANGDDQGLVKFIWGTTVKIQQALDQFREFLTNFQPHYRASYNQALADVALEAGDLPAPPMPLYDDLPDHKKIIPLYAQYMRTMRETGETCLNLDALNLLAYPKTKKLYYQLLAYPQEVVPIMDQALLNAILDVTERDMDRVRSNLQKLPERDDTPQQTRDKRDRLEQELEQLGVMYDECEGLVYKVRPFGGDKTVNMRDLNPGDTDKIVSIKGLVIRATPVIPDMSRGFFRCSVCQHTIDVDIDRGKIAEPDRCPRDVCSVVGSMNLIHNRSQFMNKQVIRLQETPDAVPDGQTPHTVSLCAYDELVDLVKPGDRVHITGIFRSIPVRVNPRQRSIKSLFKTYVDILHVKRTNVARMGFDPSTRTGEKPPGVGVGGEDDADEALSGGPNVNGDEMEEGAVPSASMEMERKLQELSRRPDIYDLLSKSMAPSIWEMDDVKKGILLQLFGGTNKSIAKGGGGGGPRYRGDINVLMVGDPGTSKSQILQYVHKIAPRGVYTSGKGSSAVGLTAYITRDPDSKQLVLESGALVLSDGGVCCIDEFDKMSDATRSVLHEVMEQQTVSIAKAGIITTLNARTSILAAANPVNSKYNPKLPIPANIDLPPTLISRFDLLYLVLDKVDEMNDRRLAKHLVGLYLEDRPDTGGVDILPLDTLTAYITYARAKIHPELTEEASQALVASYVQMRKVGENARTQEKRITATTRQLESMIRLSEAHARMRFSERVELEDVTEAFRIIREALKESATDPITGQIDLDLINTGAGQQARRMRNDLKREITALLDAGGRRGVRWSAAINSLEQQSTVPIDHSEFAEVVKGMVEEGLVKVVGEREKRTIMRISD